ncbi:hypothetical protein D3C87_659820 [compost metagenome]
MTVAWENCHRAILVAIGLVRQSKMDLAYAGIVECHNVATVRAKVEDHCIKIGPIKRACGTIDFDK